MTPRGAEPARLVRLGPGDEARLKVLRLRALGDAPACAWLLSMWVAPDYRHRGIGRQLIDAVVAWARDAGCDRIVLDVSDDNTAAIACYAALGFVPNGRAGALPAPRSHIREHQR